MSLPDQGREPAPEDLLQRLARLEARMLELEDREAIRQVLVEYGFNADLGRISEYLNSWTEDCEYEQGEGRLLKGKEQLATILARDTPHVQLLERRSQHLLSNVVIGLAGDAAWAEGYTFVLYRQDQTNRIWSCAYNQWDLRREAAGWKIVRRRRRAIGDAGCGTDVIHRYLDTRRHP